MNFQIKCRFSDKVLFETDAESLKVAVKKAVEAGAYLAGAYLADANLAGANLARANLARADLAGANLARADLAGADLAGANLARAYLARAYLADANLAGANLAGANLAGANLARANLAGANLADANLARADLAGADLAGAKNLTDDQLVQVRDDLWAVLSAAPREAIAVRDALIAGKVNGSVYEGPCACLVGTIAKARGCNYQAVDGLKANSDRPAERWFMGIKPGDTPETNEVAARAVRWIGQWIENVGSAFTPAATGGAEGGG